VKYTEIRLSGSGGQGLGLAGRILSQAAILEDMFVCQTQTYGPEARGGASRTDVIISRREILYPECRELDVLLAMNQASTDKFACNVKAGGMIIVDSTFVDQLPEGRVYEFPFTSRCVDITGKPIAANLMALGMLAGLSRYFTLETWINAIRCTVPSRSVDMNLQIFEFGHKMGREVLSMEEGRIPMAWDRKMPVPKAIRDKYSR
jgi:2-oxoglutarate ferredoxin oxidoreductase subunit gamma